MKNNSKNNTNITSPNSVSPKKGEPQDATPTNHHKRCEITNTKSN